MAGAITLSLYTRTDTIDPGNKPGPKTCTRPKGMLAGQGKKQLRVKNRLNTFSHRKHAHELDIPQSTE